MAASDTSNEDTAHKDDLDEFDRAKEAWGDNYDAALADFKFVRFREQWPEAIKKQRDLEGRPCLTIDKLAPMIRQVVNDGRQNKPSIAVHPVDDEADPETAETFNGLIRHIERSSDADVAYDTALDCSATCGFGYFGINTRYSTDDGFEQDIVIEPKRDPFAITPDPDSNAADSADWNVAFEASIISEKAFKQRYPDCDPVSVDGLSGMDGERGKGKIGLLLKWEREEISRKIVALSPIPSDVDGDMRVLAEPIMGESLIVDEAVYAKNKELFDALGVTVIGQPRDVPSFKVRQKTLSGAECVKTVDWAGKYIPIVPVWGEDIIVEGERRLSGMIRAAKDAQQMFNFWRPLALDTPIPTPAGWSTMGALRTGDQVFDERGEPCRVVGKSPVHIGRECYRVTLDDGSSIVADAEHPWPVEERAGRKAAGFVWTDRLARTDELTPGKHFIPVAGALATEEAELPVDPYVLGLWLGDGRAQGGSLTPGDEDIAEVRDAIEARGYRCGPVSGPPQRHGTFTIHGLAPQLRAAGVFGNKHIPAIYLRASEQQRRELLRGLMDTDGSVSAATRCCEFTTTSPALAAGLTELLRGLGIKAKSVTRAGRGSKIVNGGEHLLAVTQFYFTAYADEAVVGLTRKRALLAEGREQRRRRTKRHGIVSVERVPTVPVQCIAVDAPSHLFLAGEAMVPTHNTASTELVALAPKAPFIGKKGAFETDAAKWATANTQSHAYIEYDGNDIPQRQPFAGVPAGALQEALNSSDDIKSILGMYDASLGARSNETSGKAIMARQREGDVSTFNFIDNVSRAIRHAGRIMLDLIPKVYSTPRIVRILGPQGEVETVKIAPKEQLPPEQAGMPPLPPNPTLEMLKARRVERVFALDVGKYDLTVTAGPSFTSRREEAATQMIELIQAYPDIAPVIGDLLAKNLDWPGADEIAERLKAMLPAQLQGENPEAVAAKAQMEKMAQMIGQLRGELAAAKADKSLDSRALDIKAADAETKRLGVILGKDGGPYDPAQAAQLVMTSFLHIMQSPDILAGMQGGAPPEQLAQMLAARMGPPQQQQEPPAQAA
jgi:hypothetical protein